MTYPTVLDSLTNPQAGDKRNNPSLAGVITALNTATEALEAKVGVDSSAVTSSHDYKLSGVTGSDIAVSKTGTETLTNKTLTSPTINTPTVTSPTITSPSITLDNNVAIEAEDSGAVAREIIKIDGSDDFQLGNANLSGVIQLTQVWDSDVQPRCRVKMTANQSISNTTNTLVAWNTEDFDVGSLHDNVTNNTRITITEPGLYMVGATTEWGSGATKLREMLFKVNGTEVGTGGVRIEAPTTDRANLTGTFIQEFVATDYIEVQVYQDSGGSVDVVAQSTFWAVKLA